MQEPRSEAKRVAPPPADAAGNGVRAVFEEAYVRFAPRLRKVAIAKFGIPPEDAEGLRQMHCSRKGSCCRPRRRRPSRTWSATSGC